MTADAEPLSLTVHELPAPQLGTADAPAENRTRGGRWRMLLVAAVCFAPVVASYLTYFVWRPGGSSAYSTLIQPSLAMPALAAKSLDGSAVPLRSMTGQWLLVLAHDAACDTACERLLYTQRQLRDMMGRERDRLDKLWLVLDDAPVALPLQAALMANPGMHILRLPREQVAAWLKPAQGHRLEDHLYIVDPLGEWMMRAPANADPAKLKRDLDRLLRASAGWDQPGRAAPASASASTP